MTEVHWANNNYFIHYGGAGLDMFQMVGYDPVHDASYLRAVAPGVRVRRCRAARKHRGT